MLTISRLAKIAGTSPRAIRLYHVKGLLPEPARLANGYRCYTAEDAVTLLRIRHLVRIGLPLTRIASILPARATAELHAALDELDAQLATEQAQLAERRERLAAVRLLDDPSLPAFIGEQAAVLRAAGYPRELLDRETDALLVVLAHAPQEELEAISAFTRSMVDTPSRVASMVTLARDYLALADADADDPAVERYVEKAMEILDPIILEQLVASPDDLDLTIDRTLEAMLEQILLESKSEGQRRVTVELRQRVEALAVGLRDLPSSDRREARES